MLKHNPDYRRLNVGGNGLLGSASYWLGRDHLLVVATTNYVENYYRFLYADIQALIVRRQPLRLLLSVVFSALTISSLLGALAVKLSQPGGALSEGSLFGMGALLAVAVAFAALETLNLLLGPTCVCHLRTAVQTIPLPHVSRWRKAQLLVTELSQLAMAAQAQPTATASTTGTETTTGAPAPEPAGGPDETGSPPRITT